MFCGLTAPPICQNTSFVLWMQNAAAEVTMGSCMLEFLVAFQPFPAVSDKNHSSLQPFWFPVEPSLQPAAWGCPHFSSSPKLLSS